MPKDPNTPCSVQGCDGKAEKQGMCQAHFCRVRDGRDLHAPLIRRRPWGVRCSVDGCGRSGNAGGGLCGAHNYRLKRYGDVQAERPVKHIAPRGTGWTDSYGYRRISSNGREEREHRFVMEQALGRRLKRTESVHHINGNRLDNRLENLQLRNGKHGFGQAARCADCGSSHIEFVGLGDKQEPLV